MRAVAMLYPIHERSKRNHFLRQMFRSVLTVLDLRCGDARQPKLRYRDSIERNREFVFRGIEFDCYRTIWGAVNSVQTIVPSPLTLYDVNIHC